ncbi:2'-5' RNA ligase family protein [Streptomyces sp. NPDC005562]|uniref:2'-5' RNA ligase family protein n=1 Tax=Streptomyces sp. NPDC005562 TaxID=3154890 RepID=UPI00339DD697
MSTTVSTALGTAPGTTVSTPPGTAPGTTTTSTKIGTKTDTEIRTEAEGADQEADGGGWPDLPGDTALTIRVPEANPLVTAGFPAHVTVLYPFLNESRLTASTDAELRALFAAHAPFTLTFGAFRRYPGVLYLPPAPDTPVRALTRSVTARWPEAVPYRGIFDPPLAPHLTLANHEGPDTYEAAYDALESRFASALPLTAEVTTVDLIATDGPGRGWRDVASYRLGG